MYKFYTVLLLITCLLSFKLRTSITLKDGFYIGKFNKELIFNYTMLIKIKDSTVTLDAYVDEKGMPTAFNIFDNKQILPNPELFHINKHNDRYILSNSLDTVIIDVNNGSLMMTNPLELRLKYYQEDPVGKYPSKKYSLYCYCWFYPHVILGIKDDLDNFCKAYISGRMDQNLKNISEELSYENYFTMLKDSISKYRTNCDNALK